MKTLTLMMMFGLATPALASTNLVTNGSFSTGDFQGWTSFGDDAANFVADRGYTGFYEFPSDGANAELTSFPNESGLYQNLTTRAGQSYRISFQLGGAWGEAFRVDFGGVEVMRFGDVWQDLVTYSVIANATGPTSQLRFTAQNENDYYVLDNVKVSATPEPLTWAMFTLGFAATGSALRRRRVGVAG